MNTYEVGQYGYFEFTLRKTVFGHLFEPPFKMYGEIITVNEYDIKIKDCYDIEYNPERDNIKQFTQFPKPNEER